MNKLIITLNIDNVLGFKLMGGPLGLKNIPVKSDDCRRRRRAQRPSDPFYCTQCVGMNAAETHTIGELILKLRAEGLTILVIEHDMGLIGQAWES